MNKNVLYGIGSIVLVVIILGAWYMGTYNSIIGMNENVNAQWQQVEVQYQRRADLIPNIINTVKGYANFEQTVITDVTEARSAWTAAVGADAQVKAANGLESALARLIAVSENYPDLKANQNFLALQDELAGTENRIAVERQRYNNAVRDFNAAVKSFPTVFIANTLGYKDRDYFQSTPGSDQPPVVEF